MIAALVVLAVGAGVCAAQGDTQAWLRYTIPPDPPRYHELPHVVVVLGSMGGDGLATLGSAPEEESAADELDRGLGQMVAGTDVLLRRFDGRVDAIILGTTEAMVRAKLTRNLPGWSPRALPEEGFRIVHVRRGIRQWWVIQGGSPRAELYGAFRFAAMVAEDRQLPEELTETPAVKDRLVLQSDRLDGTVPEGYAGASMFFAGGHAKVDLQRVRQYARLLASVGVNGLVLSGVRLNAAQIDANGIAEMARVAAAVRPWGLRVWLGVAAAGDGRALAANVAAMYAAMPNLGGFVVDAGRDAATAEALRRAVRGMGGVVLDRGDASVRAMEFDVAGGYTGQQREVMLPMRAWQGVLAAHAPSMAIGVVNAGMDEGGLHGPMAMANLYGFGRVVWQPTLSAAAIAQEWARQTWGDDARVYDVVERMLLKSEEAYENYTSPMVQGLEMKLPRLSAGAAHFGPEPERAAVEGAARGHAMADAGGIDMVRGEGAAATLRHVPYAERLADGKTLLQTLYDLHFAGASVAANNVDAWESVRELVDETRYAEVHALLEYQAGHAEVWRDAVTEWLRRTSGIADELGYVGNHPGRVEAESMEAAGYRVKKTAAVEDSSGGAYLVCETAACNAKTTFRGEANVYRVEVGYFDTQAGVSKFELRVNGDVAAKWSAGDTLPPAVKDDAANGNTAARFTVNGVRLKAGDVVEVHGVPEHGERALLDFVEITRDPRWN